MSRLDPEHRRAQILATAKNLSYQGGLYDWTLDDVARHIGMTTPGVKHYFKSALKLRSEVITGAVIDRDAKIVLQALAKHDPIVSNIRPTLKRACARELVR